MTLGLLEEIGIKISFSENVIIVRPAPCILYPVPCTRELYVHARADLR